MAKLNKSKKDKDLYWYTNKKGEKLWMYRHKYKDIFGNRREKKKSSFESEDAALKALLKVKSDLLDGNVQQVEKDQMTVGQWLDIWYETHKDDWKVSTRQIREEAIKQQMKPLIGKEVLVILDKSTYKRKYINKLKKTYAPSTVRLFHNLFKVAVNAAVDDEILPRNRFNNIAIQKNKPRDNFLTSEELVKLLTNAKEHENETIYTFLLTLAFTGLRKGEALGLQWNNINFDDKTLTVERTRDRKGSRTPKTKNSYRTIPIDDYVLVQLRKYKNWCKKVKLRFGKRLKSSDFVFISTRTLSGISESSPQYGLKRTIERSKVKDISLHGLRHTHATILISQRIPIKVIAERLGNTPQMILEVYGHTFKELETEAVTAFTESLHGAGIGAKE
ncbi:tyrosine-type recombinase/integrase [Gracilibacillus alcaliphilus]|uniref:tyrosine-type recombinase/integrase n=1 Tax=Gracilibacillus alcaliphilus TaxID=1401441 RepID=UPI0019574D54|nr:tyrosine-type recombinase/integrase [Gracilibacillus alcaliphilus]MBM7679566.1 integrase [Gracilibacillus alcaliphilus]